MGLLDIWKKEEKEDAENAKMMDGQVFSSEYGWRSRKWLKRKENKKKHRAENIARSKGYNRAENDRIMAEYEEELKDSPLSKGKYRVGDMHYGYGRSGGYLSDDYGYGSYDYSFDKKISGGGSSMMKDYEKTGEWKGYNYYKKATVDYKYIEQMANAFSAQHNIKVNVGRGWSIMLKQKELTYDPTSLMFGTKADVIVCLLHEIGHLRYTTPAEDLKGIMYEKYKFPAHHVWNVFEDFRIDKKMITAYEGASGVYEATKKMVEKTAEMYETKAKQIRQRATEETKSIEPLSKMDDPTLQKYCTDYKLDYAKVKTLLGGGFTQMCDNLLELAVKKMSEGNIYDYVQGIILRGYGHPIEKVPEGVRDEVIKTEHIIKKADSLGTSQEVLDMLEKEVYPIIEKLLINHQEGTEEDRALFGPAGAKRIQEGRYGKDGDDLKHKMRFNPGNADTPQEWKDGDYNALKDSVDSAIKELSRKLKDIKAKDLTQKWKINQTRGKLNIKSLYRYAAGRFDIFKKKELKIDRTQNFIFSIIVDTSGSMNGDKIINAVRGSIILAEVFKNLDMPFEIMGFDSRPEIIKNFDEKFDNKKKILIGRMVDANGGSTRLYEAFKESKIIDRPEMNKYVIVLTDGAVSCADTCADEMSKWKSKYNVTPIGLNLESGYTSLSHIMGAENTQDIDEANQLTMIFEGIIKGIIKKLK